MAFGGPLHWDRMEGRLACKIYATIEGGLLDEADWDTIVAAAVPAMIRLHRTLSPHVDRARASLGL